jgi:ABC-type transport system involved in cytochrome c biogenesis permease subunit
MSLGLLLHFILRLIRFLNERRSVVALLCVLLATPNSFGQANPSLRSELSSELGRLPVQWNGRVIPVDILAANTLLQIRGRRTVALDETDRVIFGKPRSQWTEADKALVAARRPNVPENVLLSIQQRPIQLNGSELTATEWLAETCFRPWVGRHLKVFRVDHIGAQALLGRPNGDTKWYSWDEILTHVDAVSAASKSARERAQPTRDAFDRAVLNLDAAARAYAATSLTFIPPDLPPEITPSQEYLAWLNSLQKAAQEIETLRKKDPASRGFDPQLQEVIRQLVERYRDISQQGTVGIVPRAGKNAWSKLGDALLEVTEGIPLDKPAIVPNYALLAESWRTGDDTVAHKSLSDLTTLLVVPEASRVRAESNFARLQPFYWILISYLIILLAILVHWATGVEKIRRYCVVAGWTVFALHTAAILVRMLMHGYAPVTNLYGSTIFVAWGAALLGLLLESTWRNGLGLAAASAAGFGSLILAHNLALSGEDALESVRAVLDSNFWLSTHVIIVTLGYSAMFVAGMLATFHLIGRLLPRYTEETALRLSRAAYGILAFATIASFIGTMLGGIWADQSWGRFWGWDPKENGALLIVLWCAVALHARWGKLVDREGFMQLLVFGNIITAWSWFGTNLLGVGLHSYGFTESGFMYLAYFVLSQLAIIALGWLPAGNRPKQHA